METRSKSKLKKRQQNDENPKRKRQRLISIEEPEVQSIFITDINDFCLINVFKHLDIASLFNIANSNGLLRPAAVTAYQKKFGKNEVHIYHHQEPPTRFNGVKCKSTVQERDESIFIFGLKSSLQYLRCFGASVGALVIDYNYSTSRMNDHLNQYVNKYCHESLTELRGERVSTNKGRQLQKAFDTNQSLIKKPFKNLKHLSFTHESSNAAAVTTKHSIGRFLHGVQELKKLHVSAFYDDSTDPIGQFLNLIQRQPSITILVCSLARHMNAIPVQASHVKRIMAEHSTVIQLVMLNHLFVATQVIELTEKLVSLKRFTFMMTNFDATQLIDLLSDEWAMERYKPRFRFQRIRLRKLC